MGAPVIRVICEKLLAASLWTLLTTLLSAAALTTLSLGVGSVARANPVIVDPHDASAGSQPPRVRMHRGHRPRTVADLAGWQPGPAIDLSEIRAGELLWRSTDGLHPLPRGETDVHLDVTGIMVHGTVTQRFFNPTAEVIEVVYVFPLPERAAVYHMEMRIGERRIVSVIQERAEARRTYERARQEGRKAALLDQERPNLFTTSAANIAPGETVDILLEYHQELDYENGEFSLTFPLTFTPRFVPVEVELASASLPPTPLRADGGPSADAEQGAQWSLLSQLPDATDLGVQIIAAVYFTVPDADRILPPFLPTLDEHGIWADLSVSIDPGFDLATLESPSHPVDVSRSGSRWEIRPAAGRVRADRDFHLRWNPRAGADPRVAFFTEERGGECYALLMLLPPVSAGEPDALATETFFVVDVSGSMKGPSIRQAREALRAAIDRLGPDDAFNILKFNDRYDFFRGHFVAACDLAEVDAARRWVGSLHADRGTMIVPALQRAIRESARGRSERLRRIILMTDASVGNEAEVLREIAAHLEETRLHTVGIGLAPNRYLMEKMARQGRGLCTYVTTRAEAQNRIDEFLSRLAHPVLADLELVWSGVTAAETYPDPLPDLHAGEPLFVSFRLADADPEGAVRLQARGAHGEVLAGAEIRANAPRESGIAVRWARAKVGSLMDRLQEGAEREEVRAAVIDVAKEFHLVTQFTSLVAVEEVPSVTGPGRTVRMPNTLPAGSHLLGLPQGGTLSPLWWLLGVLLSALGVALYLAARVGRIG